MTVTTYSISGTLSNGAGATVTATGAGNATATADALGNYMLSGLSNGTYTITATRSGYTFNPTSQSVTVNNANVTGINFIGTSGGGGGAPAYVQSTGIQAPYATNPVSKSFSSNVTAGNLLLAAVVYSPGITATVSDSQSNTWTQLGPTFSAADGALWGLYYAFANATGVDTVSVAFSSNSWWGSSLQIAEYSGVVNVSPLDGMLVNATASTGTNISVGPVTTTAVNDLLIVHGNDGDGSITGLGTGWTKRYQDDWTCYIADAIATAPRSYSFTATHSNMEWTAVNPAVTVSGANVTGQNFTATPIS